MTNTQHIESAAITPEQARALSCSLNGYVFHADIAIYLRSLANQVESLTAERSKAEEANVEWMLHAGVLRSQRDTALALAAERLVDAERYQWLTNNCGFGIRRNGVTELTVAFHKDQPDSIHDLGAAIDAARQSAKDAS